MEKIEWEKWRYENNAPMALFRSGFSHSLVISIICFISAMGIHLSKNPDFFTTLMFTLLNGLSTIVFLFLSVVPLTLIYAIHYKLFKKIFLENKIEYYIVICWGIIFCHFLIIYQSIDYLLFEMNINISPAEFTYVSAAYIFGLAYGFKTLHLHLYNNSLPKEPNYVWKNTSGKEKTYF